MMTGSDEYRIPEQSVLLITSRRAKVEETLKEMGVVVKPTINKNGNLMVLYIKRIMLLSTLEISVLNQLVMHRVPVLL